MYDDVELYKFRFRRHDILTIVDELLDDLEYPDRHATRLLAGYSASYIDTYASLFLKLGG